LHLYNSFHTNIPIKVKEIIEWNIKMYSGIGMEH
jgi:hypothetical protein